jgi:hypothetical protein
MEIRFGEAACRRLCGNAGIRRMSKTFEKMLTADRYSNRTGESQSLPSSVMQDLREP